MNKKIKGKRLTLFSHEPKDSRLFSCLQQQKKLIIKLHIERRAKKIESEETKTFFLKPLCQWIQIEVVHYVCAYEFETADAGEQGTKNLGSDRIPGTYLTHFSHTRKHQQNKTREKSEKLSQLNKFGM